MHGGRCWAVMEVCAEGGRADSGIVLSLLPRVMVYMEVHRSQRDGIREVVNEE
jgi:hypothetical protein